MTRILGIDPGLRHTGWGIIESQGNRLRHIAHGIIAPPPPLALATRLNCLFQGLTEIIGQFSPNEAAVEETFVNAVNAASALKLGMARGVVLLAPATSHLVIGEYSANKVKKAVVGVGHASKEQVSMMVQRLLPGCGLVKADAADALAVAICHAHYRQASALIRNT
ncbi:crossover junction endodeoxyribonuclease RuvC [Candidatus Paracaedibacter symbiosus]|uniref:crossover junction endodeoxyribonuclease RuvC n=1 Tax=Candidatus Paracaedibacter symbiosus TaxID=244582 RepID=UPI0005096502